MLVSLLKMNPGILVVTACLLAHPTDSRRRSINKRCCWLTGIYLQLFLSDALFLDRGRSCDNESPVMESGSAHAHQHTLFKSACCVTCVITRDTWWITCVHCNAPLLVTCSYIRINGCQSTEQDHSSGRISLMCKPNSIGAETHRPPRFHKEQFTAGVNAINLAA